MVLVGLDFLVSQATAIVAMQISTISYQITYIKISYKTTSKTNKMEFIKPQ